ncbi:MAG: endopeptidase La [Chloroflexi bacterium]|nr:endopeptidase La [Chloroflexota bacterium]
MAENNLSPPGEVNEGPPSIPNELPILPLKDTVVYPLTVYPILVGQERSLLLVNDVATSNRLVGLVASQDPRVDLPGPGQLYTMGTVARVAQMLRVPDGTVRLVVQGLERIRIVGYTQEQPYLRASIEISREQAESTVEVEALMRNAQGLFQRMAALVPHMPEELSTLVINVDDPRHLAYVLASALRMDLSLRQELLELDSVRTKLERLVTFLTRELEVLELGKKIQTQAQNEMEKTQREYLLRQQMKAIQRELGEADEQAAEINMLREKIEQANMPEEAEREARRELGRLERLQPASPEYSIIKTYLDWLTGMPWKKYTEGAIDVPRARRILDEDHYDLEKVKERILEYLAVVKLKRERTSESELSREPILCFVGPPGVGKTSLGQSIARALGRKFVRMSLGGIRDEAEIRGHRRTYIGAMPGRIVQAIHRAESADPVFMLDEVDKVGADWRGDPTSALLEVLDPEQNKDFRDNYLNVPFDLSHVMFITTANLLDPIPAPLRDRMEILSLPGYTEEEKLRIAENYLVSKQVAANALNKDEVSFEEEALRRIIREYTREAGVRNLEREIASICRKAARDKAEGQEGTIVVTPDLVTKYLGRPPYFSEVAEIIERPGVATGLAWTPVGGDIIFIEASLMAGSKGLLLTGQLGDVMRESAQAALTYIRSNVRQLGIPANFFENSDIHVHVPAGATPKDGPSAGVAMTVSLASLLMGKPVRQGVAMTGEITLRGRVLPVGGIKEKVLAAHRAGIRTVILPKRNEIDLDDLPPALRSEMTFVLAESIDEALRAALPEGSFPAPGAAKEEPVAAGVGDRTREAAAESERALADETPG